MKNNKKFLKHIILVLFFCLIITMITKLDTSKMISFIQSNVSKNLKTIKITEDKSKVEYDDLTIIVKMPKLHHQNKNVERYINSYIRKNINKFINNEKQYKEIKNNKKEVYIELTYDIAFQDKNLINIVINKYISTGQNDYQLEKDSYIFDLKTGQRIYIDNFFKDTPNYKDIIISNIYKQIKGNISIDKNKILVDKYTNFIISDNGIVVCFNPYKKSNNKNIYEFKIPYEEFNNKIVTINSNEILVNIDTQTLTKNDKYINSILNIPIIISLNKENEKFINDKIREDIMEFYDKSYEEAKRYLDSINISDDKFVSNVDFEVKKNSDNILSLKVRYYKYSGGAHGYYNDITYNVDMRNKKLLTLSDLFKENSDYINVINEEIRHQIEEIIKNNKEYKGIYQFKSIEENNNFYIQDDNIGIYFDLYEIAPYAAGQPEFLINKNIVNHILKDEYVGVLR